MAIERTARWSRTKRSCHVVAALALAAGFGATAASPTFYPDDPIVRVVDSQDASGVAEREIVLIYDTLENSFYWPGERTPYVDVTCSARTDPSWSMRSSVTPSAT